ncbi:LacI family DNA-binding transcriptional regulator [Paenibacillus sp. BR2-3]|uniref:LacI family DNA-binding transcriptional regulator n=1 Tax=Paenibacillus sp. BR2-3 TaxID=3048494 RepID=UPI00397730F8
MKVKIKDVAIEAGVSTATVSHVINSTKNVSAEVRQKVTKAMKQLDYIPNSVARSLRSRKSNTIGLIVPIKANDNANNFFLSVANGIECILKKYGYHLLLSNSQENHLEEIERIKMFNTQNIDGLIIAPTSKLCSETDKLFGDYPVVFIDRKPAEPPGDWVLVDGTKGAYCGVTALLDKGHRKIGCIAGLPDISTSKERMDGYRQALSDYKVDFNESLLKIGDMSWETGYELAGQLLQEEGATALFVANNAMSLGAVKYLKENNIRIPEDIALIGFDDYEWTEIVHPALSVIRQPSNELGKKAAEMLIHRIQKAGLKNRGYMFEAELVVRESF